MSLSPSSRPDPTRSRQLADYLAGLSGSVDDRLLDAAANCVVDTLGAAIYGSSQPWSIAAINHATATGRGGGSTVIGGAVGSSPAPTATPAMAAFANGASAHAFELDDVHEEAISHPGAVVVPAALALAEELGSSGTELLEAVVIGYEAMGRAGIAVGPAAHMLGGFHPTSMSGVFGSAAAASRLLEFDTSLFNHAFGIAASLASGTMEFVASGGMAKRIHAGRAAEGGLTAALLAAQGFEGSTDGLAGTYGFCRVFTSDPRVELLTDRLGERWMIDEITVKPYAACSDIHPMIQAAGELRHEFQFDPFDVSRIEAEGPTKAATQNDMDGTVSVMAAQYSAQFNIAVALLADPSDPETYQPQRIADPDLARLQDLVLSIEPAEEFDATYAHKMGGRVRIHLHDGRTLERTVHGQKGSMHAPLSQTEIVAKFARMVQEPQAAAVVDAIRSIRDVGVAPLSNALGSRR